MTSGNERENGGKAGRTRDLTRYAVCDARTGEVLDVGLKRHEADAYITSYNRVMADSGTEAQRIKITWELDSPRVNLAGDRN